jgi:hypothetical protein
MVLAKKEDLQFDLKKLITTGYHISIFSLKKVFGSTSGIVGEPYFCIIKSQRQFDGQSF